jgi:hypothetical protein
LSPAPSAPRRVRGLPGRLPGGCRYVAVIAVVRTVPAHSARAVLFPLPVRPSVVLLRSGWGRRVLIRLSGVLIRLSGVLIRLSGVLIRLSGRQLGFAAADVEAREALHGSVALSVAA